LITWQPGVRGSKLKMDAVMALWFCEIVAREVCAQSAGVSKFLKNEFASARDIETRYVINLDELAASQHGFVRI